MTIVRDEWTILPECVSRNHNSLNAARGRNGLRCICPHAVELFERRKIYDLERRRDRRKERTTAQKIRIHIPDLSTGACARPENVALFQRDVGGSLARERRICRSCPVFNACRAYVLAAEYPKGAWGGVWGGLGAADRRNEGKTCRQPILT